MTQFNEQKFELKLTGDKINLMTRPTNNTSTASSRCSLLGLSNRPLSAVPLLNLYRLKEEYDTNHQNRIKRAHSAEHFNNNSVSTMASQFNLVKKSESGSLDDIKELSRSLELNDLLKDSDEYLEKQKHKSNKKYKSRGIFSANSEESLTVSEISSTDVLETRIKKLIADSEKCKEIQKEIEEMINNSKENEGRIKEEYPEKDTSTQKAEEIQADLNFIDQDHIGNIIEEIESFNREYYQPKHQNNLISNSDTSVDDSNKKDILEERSKSELTPGLKSKPPLPKKSQLPKIIIESYIESCSSQNLILEKQSQMLEGMENNELVDNSNEIEIFNTSEDDSSIFYPVTTQQKGQENEKTENEQQDVEKAIETKVQNWIQSEPEAQITHDIIINEIQTNLSLKNLINQHATVKTSLAKEDNGDSSDTNSHVLQEKRKKPAGTKLKKKAAKGENGKIYRVEDFRKKCKKRDDSFVKGLDKMREDGIENINETEFLELYLKSQGQELKTRKSVIPKAINKKLKLTKTNSYKSSKLVPKNSKNKEEISKKSIISDIESWMTYESDSSKFIEKNTNQSNPSDIKFSEIFDSISQIEIVTLPTTSQNEDRNIIEEISSERGDKDDSFDDISSVLNALKEVDNKSHENMKCVRNIAKYTVNPNISNKNGLEKGNYKNEKYDVEKKIPFQESYSVEDEAHNGNVLLSSGRDDKSSINLNEIISYLDEVDNNCTKSLNVAKERIEVTNQLMEKVLKLDDVPKIEYLIVLTPTELANQIVNMHLRLKEKSHSIIILQNELSSMREKITKMTRQTDEIIKQKLKNQKDEYESVVKRHQKFIDQLIADKKTLNQQCEGLIHETKVLEERFNMNLKAAEHRHKIELQKIKDMHKVDEKLRREKWIDNRKQKIQELTVKSLEPELEKMTAAHQRELSDLRSLQKNEIDDLELRYARKIQQQMEALRHQLTEDREKSIFHEREVMRQRYEHLVETEEKNYQEQRRKLMAEHAKRISECEERENAAYAERDRAIRQAQMDFEEKLQAAIRRHNSEIDVIKEKLQNEMDLFKSNYKKKQEMVLDEKEKAIREKFRKERDREIEMVIERLEQEASEAQSQLEQTMENRLRRLREKYENEMKDLEASEREAKNKYTEAKTKLAETEDLAVSLKASIKQLEMQLQEAKEFSEKLLNERDKMKSIIREEMRSQMEKLEKELHSLKGDKDKELQQVYSRVRMAVARKDDILQELSRDHTALQEKCAYLENMLEQQRKEYLIK